MDNYVRVVRENGNGPVDFKDGDRYTVLTLPKLMASTLRFNAEEIWGRDGYTVDTDDAFDGEEDVLEIICHGKVARKRLLREMSTVNKELKLYFGSSNYFRLGRVISHEAELVNVRDSVHTIGFSFQPFYYSESPELSGLDSFRIEGDAGAYIAFETSMTGELTFTVGGDSQTYYAGSGGLRVDGLKKSITDLEGNPVARTALKVGAYRRTGGMGDVKSSSDFARKDEDGNIIESRTDGGDTKSSSIIERKDGGTESSSTTARKDKDGNITEIVNEEGDPNSSSIIARKEKDGSIIEVITKSYRPIVQIEADKYNGLEYKDGPQANEMGVWRGRGQALAYTGKGEKGKIYRGYKEDALKFPEVKEDGVYRIGFTKGSGTFKIINKFTMVADFYEDLWYDYERKGRW